MSDNRKHIIEVHKKEPEITGTAPKDLPKFVGRLPKENFTEIKKIINAGCEKVHEDDW